MLSKSQQQVKILFHHQYLQERSRKSIFFKSAQVPSLVPPRPGHCETTRKNSSGRTAVVRAAPSCTQPASLGKPIRQNLGTKKRKSTPLRAGLDRKKRNFSPHDPQRRCAAVTPQWRCSGVEVCSAAAAAVRSVH